MTPFEKVAAALARYDHPLLEIGSHVPRQVRGVFFSNEFFDALPVEAVLFLCGEFRRRFVTWKDGQFAWTAGDLASPEVASYLRRFFPPPVEGNCYEANLEALAWIERIGCALSSGWALSIDNRYTQAEATRFPRDADRLPPPHGN